MEYSFKIVDWFALAPGLSVKEEWQAWAKQSTFCWTNKTLSKYKKIPMMMARRMSSTSILAVETALILLENNPQIDAAVFVSRHGEIERTSKIINTLAKQMDISPTDFTMSVHNTAAGLFTITAKRTIPVTLLSAGFDGFQQAMFEIQGMLSAGLKQILLVNFDGTVAEIYHTKLDHYVPDLTYAVGLLITSGKSFSCKVLDETITTPSSTLPQALLFLKNYLNEMSSFVIHGQYANWQWYYHQ